MHSKYNILRGASTLDAARCIQNATKHSLQHLVKSLIRLVHHILDRKKQEPN